MKEQYGKISIKAGSDAAKLIAQLGSRNKSESIAAQESFAAFMGPVIQQVIEQAPVVGNLYASDTYAEGTSPSVPLDVYYDVKDRNFINVWTQSIAGGLATSEVRGLDELFLNTYTLDTAVSMKKKYAREARVNVVAATMNRVAQEILVKQEINAANILLKAIADAQYDTDEDGVNDTRQVLRAATAGSFGMDDINRLFTLAARTKPSWFGGTPVGGSQGITHLLVSPEIVESIRSIAYNPVNTKAVPNTDESTVLSATDAVRNGVWNLAGTPSFFGVELVVAYEMGKGRRYNKVFAKYAASTSYAGSAFTQANEQIIVGLNLAGTNPLVKLSEAGAEGQTFSLSPDDQFLNRQDTIGFYGSTREGRAILDSRGLVGLIS